MEKLIAHKRGGEELIDFYEKKEEDLRSVLKPGYYSVAIIETMFGEQHLFQVEKTPVYPDNTFKLTNNYFKDLDYIKSFTTDIAKEIHKDLKVKYKLGILLSGKQGTGKTTVCYDLAQYFIDAKDAIVISIDDTNEFRISENLIGKYHREVNPDQMFIRIFDECEYYLQNNEGVMKNLLDSRKSQENVITFFTTNYADRIPEAIKNRKSRIKFHYEIDGITDEILIFELMSDLNHSVSNEDRQLSETELKDLVKILLEECKNPTLDEIKNSFTDAILDINMIRETSKVSI